MADQPTPEQMAEVVEGLNDEQLKEQINNIGSNEVVKSIFTEMPNAFVPEKAQGVNCSIQYDLKTDEGVKTWAVKFEDGTCTTSESPADSPRLTLQLDLLDFVRLIFGQADGTQLFMTGKLKLQGDMMFAMQMQTFFQQPTRAT